MNLKNRWPDFILPVGVIACLMVIFVPLPTGIMDLLLAVNIAVAVVVLLSTLFIKTPLEFSIFPTLLLATTFARLALNIGTTRLILTRGPIDHERAAGGVIQSFSQFVTGDNLAVGLVIFSIIVVVQFVVITKGATRISEVGARFALDGMPGRQMAIDAELNAGSIDAATAKRLRDETIAHADFYGAMDGASKFVRGDAIAGVIITLINIVGGFAIGLASQMTFAESAQTFTKLTIGDGLVSQLPALMISLAAGILVTRSTTKTDLPRESIRQVFARPVVLVLTAIFLGMLIFTSLPKTPLLLIIAGCLVVAYLLVSETKQRASSQAQQPTSVPAPPTELTIDKLLNTELLEMELGSGLIRLADTRQGGQLLNRVAQVRKEIAAERGIILPKVRIRDNLTLGPMEFQILIQGDRLYRGESKPGLLLAIDRGNATGPIDQGAVVEIPPKGMLDDPAFWIDPDSFQATRSLGYDVLAPDELVADRLKQTVIENAAQLLTRDAMRQLIDEVRKTSPAVVEELLPDLMSLGQIQQVLKALLEEGVSIRPLSLILETLGDHAGQGLERGELVERVRLRLARHITSRLKDRATDTLLAFTISPEIQDRIACAWERVGDELRIGMSREFIEHLAFVIEQESTRMVAAGYPPLVVVDQRIRPVIAELAKGMRHPLIVMGTQEIEGAEVQFLGQITADQISARLHSAA